MTTARPSERRRLYVPTDARGALAVLVVASAIGMQAGLYWRFGAAAIVDQWMSMLAGVVVTHYFHREGTRERESGLRDLVDDLERRLGPTNGHVNGHNE